MGWVADAMVFLIPMVGAISLFTFLAVVGWAEQRRRERETYYRYEFRKRLLESGQMNAADLHALHRYEVETEQQSRRQKLMAGGMITCATGVGLILGLQFIDGDPVWMVGYIPLLIGAGMLVYALFLAPKPSAGEPPLRPPGA